VVKIVFIGAGSIIFVKNIIGDCLTVDVLQDAEYALLDIDAYKLELSLGMLQQLNMAINNGRAQIKAYTDQKEALRNADFVINAIQVGGYDPYVVNDFEIPLSFGLQQTYADSLGVGGIFRGLRTIPVMQGILRDMEKVCPDALFINYTNPMGIIMATILHTSPIRAIGLCHSVQKCAQELMESVGMVYDDVVWEVAGINHQAWLLKISQGGKDLYPEIKARSREMVKPHKDLVRHEIMHRFGFYVTESSLHSAEYMPYFIKSHRPQLLEHYGLDTRMYRNWGISQQNYWAHVREQIDCRTDAQHVRTEEYASFIMEAMIKDQVIKIGANVLNNGCVENLPYEACVEVPCMVDGGGVTPCHVGRLPEQCAGLNRTNVNVQLMVMDAAIHKRRESIYHAAMLDPRTSQELTLDEIVSLCDKMIQASSPYMAVFESSV
jgi:alpha-galactosidase